MESITITYRGENFCLVLNSGNDDFLGSQAGSRSSGSDLQRFDDPELQYCAEYKYPALPDRRTKKMIRLLKLMSGAPTGREIFCELIEATYDKNFRIPTTSPIDSSSSSHGGKGGGLGTPQAGDGGDDESNRSEQEDCWKPQKVETEGEARKRAQRKGKRRFDKLAKELSAEPDKAKAKEESRLDELVKEWEGVKKNEVQYEALSWTWRSADEQYLALALKYLRRPGEERILWIDAICINQDNLGERNHQVQLMSRIYTRASQVCVWLGEDDSDSKVAISFIKEEIRELKNFDTISSTPQYSRKWRAWMSLMQREWFFRRWVVQKIALATAATVYCGPHSVP
ncbi:heterokaryon incompatibility protein-domain-containing protein [Lasiosphaeria miniovina]|uniref:Heterokaryon incompatibility protein-domain-containing protein n=1 Tax=Lasiosphaeria miniovina TaxID=1954250 RepID=A0AA40A0Q8_9PEZI|nr:heterokaryon incompatibility protein-domain-containing protein [Lasiosphaeria miniovina]KAK0706914.1 heterokaryon incompatibility protein-domain-containing protein [Lasiosphaeria miniovina]